ncbi:MAG: RelA/SpoT domain-containing protein [Sphingomonas taxi]
MLPADIVEESLKAFDKKTHDLRIFMNVVQTYIGDHPDLNDPADTIIHSYKTRLKDRNHLAKKIERKLAAGRDITPDNFFFQITDLAGVRILHLFQGDFAKIDAVIRSKIAEGDWVLGERAKAYSWDPEAVKFFMGFDIEVEQKESFYTSAHYLIKPRLDSPICCELQVRTLFEEIWGEVDHLLNYPTPSTVLACQEQLKVLSKIVGGGSRLLDSIQRITREAEAD